MELTPQQKVQAYINSLRRIGWEVNFGMPANFEGDHLITVIKYDPKTFDVETFRNFTGSSRIAALHKALKELTK